MNSLVVNLFAGPSVGKSLVAADIFQQLKRQHYSCELVYETAKELVWDNKIDDLKNQLWIAQEQLRKIHRLQNKVEIIIVDSPLLLGGVYDEYRNGKSDFSVLLNKLLLKQHNDLDNFNVLLERNSTPFEIQGRADNYEQSLQIDKMIISMLDMNNIKYVIADSSEACVKTIIEMIKDRIRGEEM